MKVAYLLMLGDAWRTAMASFYTGFGGLRQHADLLLEWEPAEAADYPLALHVRVFNATSDHIVNTFETDIATGLTEDSFIWNDLPSPLPFLSSATYQLQVVRQLPAGGTMSGSVITLSTPFSILPESKDGNDDNNRVWPTTTNAPEPANSHTSHRPDSNTAIAAGLVVPFVVGISVFVFICMQRRRKKTLEERRKERQTLVID
ncbi:hypothetical protein RRF57_004503 [Xylaria bambusicola]|uniref:Uncharacterized protein n=1 Tax=Xylaria bambusicola TaxID=326684 RepID=A0AAN7UJB3_9PEZI